jgi:hypothetical protein
MPEVSEGVGGSTVDMYKLCYIMMSIYLNVQDVICVDMCLNMICVQSVTGCQQLRINKLN